MNTTTGLTAMEATSLGAMDGEQQPTDEQYTAFQLMFDHFNKELFSGQLPRVLLTFSRVGSHRTIAFFIARHWRRGEGDAAMVHEMSLCPAFVAANAFRDTAASLVHEMCHLWQEEFGTPPRTGYHSVEWSQKMLAVGLQPIDAKTGKAARSAHSMHHQIIVGGRFELAYAELPAAAVLPWECVAASPNPGAKPGDDGDEQGGTGGDDDGEDEPAEPVSSKNKVKYSCTTCKTNVWGAPGLVIACLGSAKKGNHAPALLALVGATAHQPPLATH